MRTVGASLPRLWAARDACFCQSGMRTQALYLDSIYSMACGTRYSMDHLSVSACVFVTHTISFRLLLFWFTNPEGRKRKPRATQTRPLEIGDGVTGLEQRLLFRTMRDDV
jgi:hypothetical protein